jgi:ribonuclease E
VICDLIDMRNPKNRKTIENRFRERLRRDRARSTTLPISSFGILEMTRQRMRGSHESVHFATCPSCRGRGLLQKPDSVAADALQDLAALLDHERVAKVEMVVNQRVAAALLSTRRAALTRIEHLSGKIVDVRISDALQGDRVTYYAYDESGADIGIEKLPGQSRKPELVDWFIEPTPKDDNGWAVDMRAEAEEVAEQTAEAFAEAQAALEEMQHETGLLGLDDDESEDEAEGQPKKKRRRRRRGRRRGGSGEEAENTRSEQDGETASESGEAGMETTVTDESGSETETDDHAEGEAPAKKKRRRRRRRRGSDEVAANEGASSDAVEAGASESDDEAGAEVQAEASPETEPSDDAGEDAPVKKKRRRRRRGKSSEASTEAQSEESEVDEPKEERSVQEQACDDGDEPAPAKKKRRRTRSRKPASENGDSPERDAPTVEVVSPEVPAPEPKPRRRSLYGASRRKLSPAERTRAAED